MNGRGERPRILALESSVASRVAAGEVVERPVSAAKELLENALDAGAGDVRLFLEQGGKASLVVEDDGGGIAYDDLPLALERYATSKIRSLEDLERVATLGYRGEALSSIAAVSRLELRSRVRQDELGGVIRCEGGQVLSHSRIPAAPGTRVQVDDLFYNLPARRKFLRTAAAELKRIIQLVQDYSLVHPGVRFRVVSDGKPLLDVGESAGTGEALQSLWGSEGVINRGEASREGVSVRLWWNALPGSRRVGITSFVNGRRVQDPTIRSALHSVGTAVYGEWVVLVELPPEEVDVNIHPAKAEVRFRRNGSVFEAVRRAAWSASAESGGAAGEEPSPVWTPGAHDTAVQPQEREPALPVFVQPYRRESIGETGPVLFSAPKRERSFLGQSPAGYLVFKDASGLCLLDAHAAHERILYEQIEDSFADGKIPRQGLMIELEVPPGIRADVLLCSDELEAMGFGFRTAGNDLLYLAALPVLVGLGRMTPLEMLRSALRGLKEERDPSKRDREVWWRWARSACRDAVKLGRAFEAAEALDLFERLEQCREPQCCPHGRPTAVYLADDKLRSWFER